MHGGMNMKKIRIAKICLTLCLIIGMLLLPINQLKVQAAESFATVQGSILSGTKSDLLLLSTKEGKMEIKMDSETDASACKVLLPGKEIYVSVSHGSDGYLHAVKITSTSQTTNSTIDSSSSATVTGTIGENTKDDLLYFKTAQGEMEIKLDPTTSMSGCSVLIIGEKYSITCARGSDAYMHAISISDGTSTTSSASATAASINSAATASVTGTVSSNTTESILYLSTKDGEMQFKIDSNADTSKGMVHTSGNKLTVYFYHGSDGYLHAVTTVGEKESSTATVNTSSTVTVNGTVGTSSTESILYLETSEGKMELKLDAVNTSNSCKVLISGKKVAVTCAYGSDAYMHAIDITAR